MRFMNLVATVAAATLLAALFLVSGASAQEKGKGKGKGPTVVSPEVKADRTVVFRIYAPKAEKVTVNSSDLPGKYRPRDFKKGETGIWELALGPVDPGTYRYVFNVDGVTVADSKNTATSESNATVWSVVHVPGSDFMDTTNVPHGAVARVYYPSSTLKRTRRMHVYTPPGYETSTENYPVFYLLHGAGDCDDSWTSVGRANFILDNLIASKKAKPMIVVMPAGHTGPSGGKGGLGARDFERDFQNDIVPYIEKHYRTLNDRLSHAIAGLSMGGAQTLTIAIARPKDFAYVGVYSSGLLFGKGADTDKAIKAGMADAEVRKGLKLLWFATGSEDFLLRQTRDTVALFRNSGNDPVFRETSGGHTWINWRLYLNEFAPQLFR
jgi:enterochelin esterase-like enzyme